MAYQEKWPDGVVVPIKYRGSGRRLLPFYVRQLTGPQPHEDRVLWMTGPMAAKTEFLKPTKDKAYLYDLACISIDPDCALAQSAMPEAGVNMKQARRYWAAKKQEQEIYRKQQGLDGDEEEYKPPRRGPGRPRKEETVVSG